MHRRRNSGSPTGACFGALHCSNPNVLQGSSSVEEKSVALWTGCKPPSPSLITAARTTDTSEASLRDRIRRSSIPLHTFQPVIVFLGPRFLLLYPFRCFVAQTQTHILDQPPTLTNQETTKWGYTTGIEKHPLELPQLYNSIWNFHSSLHNSLHSSIHNSISTYPPCP